MTSTVRDAIRDQIADIRFSRRKLAHPECFGGRDGEEAEERAYLAECMARVRRLFKARHSARPNRFGWFE